MSTTNAFAALTPVWWVWKTLLAKVRRFAVTTGGETQLRPGATNAYQLLMAAGLALGLLAMNIYAPPPLPIRIFAAYRAWEIFVHAARGLVGRSDVARSRLRAIPSLVINLVELSAAYAILGLSLNVPPGGQWEEVAANLGRVLTLRFPESLVAPYGAMFVAETWIMAALAIAQVKSGKSKVESK